MTLPDDRDLLADLYVLGLLDDAEHAEAERLIGRDPDLSARVAAAARRFAPLDDTLPGLALPDGAWDRLERRLAEAPPHSSVPDDIAVPPANLAWPPGRRALAVAAGLVLALGLGWALLGDRAREPAAVAVLFDPTGAPFALIEDFGNGEAAVVTLTSYDVPQDRSLQVWTKWSEEVGPVSLGVLEQFEGAVVGGEDLPAPAADQLYEITLEAEGGTATGRPTGPILGVGRAAIPD